MSQPDVTGRCCRTFSSWRLGFTLVISYMLVVTLFVALTYSTTRVRRDANLVANSSLSSLGSVTTISSVINSSEITLRSIHSVPGYVDRINNIRWFSKMSTNPLGPSCPTNSTYADPRDVVIKLKSGMSVESYLDSYTAYCCAAYKPRNTHLPPCPCVPDQLLGQLNMSESSINHYGSNIEQPELGGSWTPGSCGARHRVAIIIPYRDRVVHLKILLNHLHAILQRQMLEYTIVVVEQNRPEYIFNKAALMNVGYLTARSLGEFDCFVFHDVDIIAEDDRSFYTCLNQPRHIAAYLEKHNYTILYGYLFGGITALTPWQFEKMNGFSNAYYGWGGEDDDFSHRVRYHKMRVIRFPKCVARHRMIVHEHDKLNPRSKLRHKLLAKANERIAAGEGLKSIQYNISSVNLGRHCTHFLVDIPDPTPEQYTIPKT